MLLICCWVTVIFHTCLALNENNMAEGSSHTKGVIPFPDVAIVGMVHVQALPATPYNTHSMKDIIKMAVQEAVMLAENGVDGILIENMFDRPYMLADEVGPEVVAAMTAVGAAIRKRVSHLPLGIQILAAANRQAMAVAMAIGAQFIRVEGFAFAAVADEGLIPRGAAGDLLRYRRYLGVDDIKIFADVKKKHSSHAITADVDDAATAAAFVFFGADGVVVTGEATGDPALEEDVVLVNAAIQLESHSRTGGVDSEHDGKSHNNDDGNDDNDNNDDDNDNISNVHVIVGSGVTKENLEGYVAAGADIFIVGSSLKRNNDWKQMLVGEQIQQVVEEARRLRNQKKKKKEKISMKRK